jgi:predicted regulator of Ras-like GTPase activity (Roadblock/LC7/MglB family)
MTYSNGYQPAHQSGRPSEDLDWLLRNFAQRTVGVNEAVAVSSDGFVLAASQNGSAIGIEQLAAIIAGLTSLTRGAATLCQFDSVRQIIVEMDGGYFFVMSASDGSNVGVLADQNCDVGLIGYEMTMLIERVGAVLTPALIDELKNAFAARGERPLNR